MKNLGQYRSNTTGGVGNYTSDNVNNYIKLIKDGKVQTIQSISTLVKSDTQDGKQEADLNFYDSCVTLQSEKLLPDKVYYFHGKIRLDEKAQNFNIILFNYANYLTNDSYDQQFIKSISIKAGANIVDEEGIFVDIEFIFQPFTIFDTICFELTRGKEDYKSDNPRVGCIIYQELSEIQNIITTCSLGNNREFKKIGIQTRPSALMSINGEEIRVGRSGIYELREDTIPINSFSLFTSAEDVLTQSEINSGLTKTNDLYKHATESICLFSHDKVREIVPFSLDYIYEE